MMKKVLRWAPAIDLVIVLLLAALVGGIMLYFLVSKKQKEGPGRKHMGDLYAIQLAKPRLKSRGYRSFYTRQG